MTTPPHPPVRTAAPPSTWGERYLAHRRPLEVGYWVVVCVVGALANGATTGIDIVRNGLGFAPWEPYAWEGSSHLAVLLLGPAVVWFTARFPVHLDTWRRVLPGYLLASVAWSLLHVGLMVAMRKAVYAAAGTHYTFDSPWEQMAYEYIKDIRTFANMVVLLHAYRWVVRRLQGEASVLDVPEPALGATVPEAGGAATAAPRDRPERFLVRKLGREFLVAAAEIEWVQASGNYTNLHVRGRDYPLRSTLAQLQEQLDPARFVRVHRSYVVNLDQLASIEPQDGGEATLHLKDGGTLPCSRRYRPALRSEALSVPATDVRGAGPSSALH